MEYKTKLLILGSGPAGCTAAIYAARAGLKPVLVSGTQVGGQLTITNEIENFPGFPEIITGQELIDRMHQQVKNLGVEFITDNINEVNFKSRPFVCKSENGNTFVAESVIIATGATARLLGIPSEKKFIAFGVSACATCDGFFYKGKDVCIIGGGNTAVQDALLLSHFAKSVTIVHNLDKLTAEKYLQDKLLQNQDIKLEWSSVVEEILGTDTPKNVTGLRIKNLKNGEIKEIKTDGIFLAIGYQPKTDIFKGQLDMDEHGYIKVVCGAAQTSVPGVFAAGDVRNQQYKQAVISAASGATASLEAEEWLSKN